MSNTVYNRVGSKNINVIKALEDEVRTWNGVISAQDEGKHGDMYWLNFMSKHGNKEAEVLKFSQVRRDELEYRWSDMEAWDEQDGENVGYGGRMRISNGMIHNEEEFTTTQDEMDDWSSSGNGGMDMGDYIPDPDWDQDRV